MWKEKNLLLALLTKLVRAQLITFHILYEKKSFFQNPPLPPEKSQITPWGVMTPRLRITAIEADPQNLTKYFHSWWHLFSSSSNKTSSSELHYFWCITKINVSIPGSCDIAALYYIVPASADRNWHHHNQHFSPASLAEDLITIIFIQTQASEKAFNILSMLVALWPLEKPLLYWLFNLRIIKYVVL